MFPFLEKRGDGIIHLTPVPQLSPEIALKLREISRIEILFEDEIIVFSLFGEKEYRIIHSDRSLSKEILKEIEKILRENDIWILHLGREEFLVTLSNGETVLNSP